MARERTEPTVTHGDSTFLNPAPLGDSIPSGTPEPEDAEEGRGRRVDAELLGLGRIIRILEEHDDAAQARMMAYLASRYKQQ